MYNPLKLLSPAHLCLSSSHLLGEWDQFAKWRAKAQVQPLSKASLWPCFISAHSVRYTPTRSRFVEDIPGAWNGTWLEHAVTSKELAGLVWPEQQLGQCISQKKRTNMKGEQKVEREAKSLTGKGQCHSMTFCYEWKVKIKNARGCKSAHSILVC